MTSKHPVVIAEPVRTAIGTFGGTLKDIPAVGLGATAISAALQRTGLRTDEIGTVVMGNAVQAGNKMNPARQAAIHAGLPVQVPAMTVNRVCGSGAQAIVSAAQEILMGSVDTASLAAWRTWMQLRIGSAWPMGSPHGRRGPLRQRAARRAQRCVFGCTLGLAYGRSGNEVSDQSRSQDEWALRSHKRSPPRRPPENSLVKSCPLKFPGGRARARSKRTSITGRTRQSRR